MVKYWLAAPVKAGVTGPSVSIVKACIARVAIVYKSPVAWSPRWAAETLAITTPSNSSPLAR